MNEIIKSLKKMEGTPTKDINKEALYKGYIVFGDIDISLLPKKSNKLTTLFKEDDTLYDKIAKTFLEYDASYGAKFFNTQIREVCELDFEFEEIEVLNKKDFSNFLLETISKPNALRLELINEIVDYLFNNQVLFDLGQVKNNDAFSALISKFGIKNIKLDNGDDVLRALFASYNLPFIKNKVNLYVLNDEVQKDVENVKSLINNNMIPLSTIFKRQKKIFLSLKRIDKDLNKMINKISKMSNKTHKPFVAPAINRLNEDIEAGKDIDFSKFSFAELVKAYNSNENKVNDFRFYNIRNGKVFYKEADIAFSSLVQETLKQEILKKVKEANDIAKEELKEDENFQSDFVLVTSKDLKIAVPTSGKTIFAGITEGTKMELQFGDKLGIYWKNSYGASDLDLSLIDENGIKLGWDRPADTFTSKRFNFSGDITDAPNGANETFTIEDVDNVSRMLVNNVYYGDDNSELKLIRIRDGKIFETNKFASPSRSTVLGIIKDNEFIFNIKGSGNRSISSLNSTILLKDKKYLYFDDIIYWFNETFDDELIIVKERDITSLSLSDYSL